MNQEPRQKSKTKVEKDFYKLLSKLLVNLATIVGIILTIGFFHQCLTKLRRYPTLKNIKMFMIHKLVILSRPTVLKVKLKKALTTGL